MTKPTNDELGAALWCAIASVGGAVRIPHRIENEYRDAGFVCEIETTVDPMTGEAIVRATRRPRK